MDIEEIIQAPLKEQPTKQVVYVPIGNVITNPFQPRKRFDTESLQELAESIKEFGILQPLLVVELEDEQYLLIAGERRLRAAYIAQLEKIPVLLGNYSSQEVAEIAMIENLQREDLHFLDEAEGYDLIMREFHITQDALAKRVGKKQSTVANKLRTLKLDKDIREKIRENSLTERHARAMLKIDNTETQMMVLQAIIDNELNVRQTEELVDGFLNQENIEQQIQESLQEAEKTGKRTKVIRDVRIFINSVKKVVDDIKKSGVKVKLEQKQIEDEIILTMKIPLHKADDKTAGKK